jgi:hypothetical protein
MLPKPDLRIEIVSNDGKPSGEWRDPRKVTVKSGFGAQARRAWIELYNEQIDTAFNLGDELRIFVNQTRCFRGFIRQIRLDNQGDLITLYADWQPDSQFNTLISREVSNVSATEILQTIVQGSGLSYQPDPEQTAPISRLEFQEQPLPAVIDLLAKLAGNWRWDIDDDSQLHFRPFGDQPDHRVHLAPDQYSVHLWEHENEADEIKINAGVVNGEELSASVILQELANSTSVERIYVRPIVSQDVMNDLLAAIEMQANTPHYSHTVDIDGSGEYIIAGDTVQFTFTEPLEFFPTEQQFRVKIREIIYAHEQLTTRLHLTCAFESNNNYFDDLKTDKRPTAQYRDSHVGAFQLDASSLDSESHLDAA